MRVDAAPAQEADELAAAGADVEQPFPFKRREAVHPLIQRLEVRGVARVGLEVLQVGILVAVQCVGEVRVDERRRKPEATGGASPVIGVLFPEENGRAAGSAERTIPLNHRHRR